MNFVCIVFELGDKMLTLSSMENLIVQCNHKNSEPHMITYSLSSHFLLVTSLEIINTGKTGFLHIICLFPI